MKIFVASSWKNRERVREISNRLRKDGHLVYDFTDFNTRKVPECPPENQQEPFDPEIHKSYAAYLKTEKAARMYASVMNNQEGLRWCDLAVMLLPCGNDAHMDFAYALGLGKRGIVCGQPRKGEQSYTQMWAEKVIDSVDDAYEYIKRG